MALRKTSKGNISRRLESVESRANGALSLFQRAAADLEAASTEAEAVATEADEQVTKYNQLRQNAQTQAATNRSRAAKIREFVGE